MIVLPLRPLMVGDAFTLQDWPLHVTLAPTFVIGGGLPAVLTAVTAVLSNQPTLDFVAGEEDGFGGSGRFPVTLVEPTIELSRLHARLVAALLTADAEFDHPQFVGGGYRPHITIKGGRTVRASEHLTLRQTAVVDMAPAGADRARKVVWTTDLADPAVTAWA